MLKLTFINVGYGEAILLTLNRAQDRPFTMLIDGGGNEPEEFLPETGRLQAARFLRQRGVDHIDLLVATHIHEDHICGLEAVLQDCGIDRFWHCYTLPPNPRTNFTRDTNDLSSSRKFAAALSCYTRLWNTLVRSSCSMEEHHGVQKGIPLAPGLSVDILGPSKQVYEKMKLSLDRVYTGDSTPEQTDALDKWLNQASMILRLQYAQQSILLPSDVCRLGMDILRGSPELLRADVLKTAHHGQSDSLDDELVRMIRPRWVVTCGSSDRRYESSNPITYETIDRVMSELEPNVRVRYLFSDQVVLPGISEDIMPRHGLTLTLDIDGSLSAEYERA